MLGEVPSEEFEQGFGIVNLIQSGGRMTQTVVGGDEDVALFLTVVWEELVLCLPSWFSILTIQPAGVWDGPPRSGGHAPAMVVDDRW